MFETIIILNLLALLFICAFALYGALIFRESCVSARYPNCSLRPREVVDAQRHRKTKISSYLVKPNDPHRRCSRRRLLLVERLVSATRALTP